MPLNENNLEKGEITQVAILSGVTPDGVVQRPVYGQVQADGSVALEVAVVSGGGAGGASNTVAATTPGTSATTANPVQGVTGGVPFPVTGALGTVSTPNVVVIKDSVTGNEATISAFHNADNQQPGATAYGILTGGVAQLNNAIGNLDRQTETSNDGIPQNGIASGAQQMASPFATTSATTIAINATTATIVVAAASGLNRGAPWAIQIGSQIYLDTTSDPARVTAVTGTSVTIAFKTGGALAHSGTYAVKGFVYNQARDATIADGSIGLGIGASATELFNNVLNSGAGGWEAERSAAGELDGASGVGTAIAAGYEYNGGAANGVNNYDRERNLQGKGVFASTLSAIAAPGATSLSVAAVTGLLPGSAVYLEYNTANQEVVYVTQAYVSGTTTVALQSATAISHASSAAITWDTYVSGGPGLNGLLPTGVGIEEDVVYNPLDGKFYLERSATADGMAGANIPAENLALYNGTTFDRASGSAANGQYVTQKVGGVVVSNANAFPVAIISGGGGSSNTVVATAAGTSATTANPVQGVTGGVALPVSGTFFQTTQPVSGTFFQTTQPISGAVSVTSLSALTAGSAAIGQVGGKTAVVEVTPTVTAASAYAIGNVVGGLLTFSSALLAAQSGVVQSIRVKSKSIQTVGFKLYVFKTIPTTTFTDKTAPSIVASDIPFLFDDFALASPDSGLGTHTLYSLNTSSSVVVATSTTLYGILVTTGTPTFPTASDITISIGILQD